MIQKESCMDASNKQPTVAEKFAAVWEKKSAKVARAGGVSLMALSLAACGSDDDTAATDGTTTDDTSTTPVVPAGVTLALAAAQDIVTSAELSTGADSVTATQATIGATDVIVDATSDDGDTLTVSSDGSAINLGTVAGVENIVVNLSDFGTAGVITATNVADGTLTVNNLQAAGSDDATVTAAGSITVVAGSGVTDVLDVTMAEDAATVVNAGEAASVKITTTAGDDQVATLVANGNVALETVDTAGTLTDVNITSTVASEVTLTDTGTNVDTIVGDANTTVVAAGDLSDFSTLTVSGVAAIEGTGATSDLTSVASAINVTDGETSSLTLADGATVTVEVAAAADSDKLTFVALEDEDTDVDAEQTLNLILSGDTSDANTKAGGYDIFLDDNATDAGNEITTLNLTIAGDLDHAAAVEGDVSISIVENAIDTTINLDGTGDIDLVVDTFGADVTLNASALSGALVTTATAEMLSITGGSGDDTIVNLTAVASVLDGGAGTDTLTTALLNNSATFTNFEVIALGQATNDFDASQLSGKAFSVTGGTDIEINATGSVDIADIDLSGLSFATATVDVKVDLTKADTSLLLSDQEFTYVGSDVVDTVVGSANADTITGGEGADTITGGAGADTIILTETTSAADTVLYAVQTEGSDVGTVAGTFSGFDVITGFTVGADFIDLETNVTAASEVWAQTDATTAANDLSDAEYNDVDAVAAFLADIAANQTSVVDTAALTTVAITFSDFTAVYVIDNNDTSAPAVGEIELLARVDDAILTATELT